ncbi:hypothetical protein [Nocardia suismassiliense]|uniref:hypothetical protein n=1 Tax=Nocardia suismassiliense TaxID=2077092 RepID=UPI00131F3D00|nr:hypothetical protein [Nocardia suismassiliense]
MAKPFLVAPETDGHHTRCPPRDKLSTLSRAGWARLRTWGIGMFRRLALIAVLMVTAVACQENAANPPEPPVATGPEAEMLARLRTTDICALLPRAELAKLGPVTAVGTDQLYGCRAKFGTDRNTGTEVDWLVRAVDQTGPDQGANVTIDGMTVNLLGDNDARSPEEVASASTRTCTAYAQLPTGGSMSLMVTIPPGTEPCPAAQSLVAVALAEWKRHPRVGDSPDTVRTAVTGKDPCAVLAKLPDAIRGDSEWGDRCWFRLDGDAIYVGYGHSTDREFKNYERVEVAGQHAYWTSNQANGSYRIHVGQTFDPVADNSDYASVPAVTINGRDRATLEKVTAAVLEVLPAVK